jgi:hypothetical protein
MPLSAEEFGKLSEEDQIRELQALHFSNLPEDEQIATLQSMHQQQQGATPQQQQGATPQPEMGKLETAVGHFAQGLTFNFADEIAGLAAGAGSFARGGEFESVREETTEKARQALEAGSQQHPGIATGAQVAGGLASLAIPGSVVARSAKASQVAGQQLAKQMTKAAAESGVKMVVKPLRTSAGQSAVKQVGKTVAKGVGLGAVAGLGAHGVSEKAAKSAAVGAGANAVAIAAGKAMSKLGGPVVGALVTMATGAGSLVGSIGKGAALKVGNELIKKGSGALPKGLGTPGFRKMVDGLKNGSEALKPYQERLFKAAFESGGAGLAAVHADLVQQDRNYGRAFK